MPGAEHSQLNAVSSAPGLDISGGASDQSESTSPLELLWAAGVLQEIDFHFARSVRRLDPGASEWVPAAAALCSRAVQAGHVCLDLVQLVNTPLVDSRGERHDVAWPDPSQWAEWLSRSPLVGKVGEACALVLDGDRVYLPRYATYQMELADALTKRARERCEIDEQALSSSIQRHFGAPSAAEQAADHQRLAALLCACRLLTIISGGPGTGKTTTVAKILTILTELALDAGQAAPRITLLAPTGKAAQRLSDSLANGLLQLNVSEEVRALVSVEASTIHRALGTSARTPTRFVRNRHRPLTADVVLVDEASMVDLALMSKLVEAVPSRARLLMLGDKDQLASVEAGAIFGDIFNADADHSYSDDFAELAARHGVPGLPAGGAPAGLQDCTVHLERNYRYGDDSTIAKLATGLRRGNSAAVVEVFGEGGSVAWIRPQADSDVFDSQLQELIVENYRPLLTRVDPATRLKALSNFRVLCAHRAGARGVSGLNELAEKALARADLITPDVAAYDGRPIMVTENDYQTQLFNGDVGVLCKDAETGRIWAWFAAADGVRRLPVSRLPQHETVFAMTVHKSQGSEFDHVALVLPEGPSPVLCRELIYTGVTRARERITLFGAEEVLRDGVDRPVLRASGLRQALWPTPTK